MSIAGEPQGRFRFAGIGECMVEMRQTGYPNFAMAFGGDTANTAVYLARLVRGTAIDIDYISAVGDDPFSAGILRFLEGEGVGTTLIRRLESRMPGLYFVRTNEDGERFFYYFRSAAAARDMFLGADGHALLRGLESQDQLYLSGITLSILDRKQREGLLEAVAACRKNGGRLVFDGNYRPAGWASPAAAKEAFVPFLACTDIALVTLDDERVVFGDKSAEACIDRLVSMGASEVVIKLGSDGCLITQDGGVRHIATTPNPRPVDTTAAGDSFNAAYLASRIAGLSPAKAAGLGNQLAGSVIRHPGAIIASKDMPLLTLPKGVVGTNLSRLR